MKSFNVIIYNFNAQKFESYDIMPYLISVYRDLEADKRKQRRQPLPKTYDEFKQFVNNESMYQWWGRCEYEIILVDWPGQKHEEKWDIYQQIQMNLDLITETLIWNLMKENDE